MENEKWCEHIEKDETGWVFPFKGKNPVALGDTVVMMSMDRSRTLMFCPVCAAPRPKGVGRF